MCLWRKNDYAWIASALTAHLVEPLQEVEAKLVERKQNREATQVNTLERQAQLQQADFQLDQAVRLTELSVSKHVEKNREAPDYRAAFPRGSPQSSHAR